MRCVVIQVPDDGDPVDYADLVKHVGSQLEEGYREGRIGITTLNWSIEDSDG